MTEDAWFRFANEVRLFWPQKLGNRKILIGIGAWVPYFLIKNALEPGLSILSFLIIHLSGMLGGILMQLNIIGKFLQCLPHPMIRE